MIDPFQEDTHDFLQLFIEQLIETIEFVLGSLSNTASFLRLWALSLAHNQLSKVFLDIFFLSTLQTAANVFWVTIVVVGGVFIYMLLTFSIIMLMDVMECSLHALRLH